MSNVWEPRYRLLLEELEVLANQLSGQEPIAQAVRNDQMVRLLTGVVMLLRQHRVNKQGQCQYCGRRWRFWQKQPQCTVYRCIDFALRQPLDMVLGQLREDQVRLLRSSSSAWNVARTSSARPAEPLTRPPAQ